MKNYFLITVFLYGFQGISGQETFFDVYSQVLIKEESYRLKYEEIDLSTTTDSLRKIELHLQESMQYRKDLSALQRKVTNLTFPDISFSDINGKTYSVSDFKQEVVINYNYMFCASCMARIDVTVLKTTNRNVKIIVLFRDLYRKDYALLKTYDDKVLVGFINDDTKDFISLKQGDDCMYYLDENRVVECFDQRSSEAWIKFLDKNKS